MEGRLNRVEEVSLQPACLHGLCISSYLQVLTLFEFLSWNRLMMNTFDGVSQKHLPSSKLLFCYGISQQQQNPN